MSSSDRRIPSRHPRTGWICLGLLVLIASGVWFYAAPFYVRMALSGQTIAKNPSGTTIPSDGSVPGRRPGELAVVFFNVRYGDGILIQAPNNVTSLIDGGEGQYPESPQAPAYNWGYELYVPFFNKIGLTQFKNFVSTVPASHHMGVLPDLLANRKLSVKNVFWTGYKANFSAHRRFRIHARDKSDFQVISTGDRIDFGPGVKARVLFGPDDVKVKPRASRVILMKYGNKRFLFMSDLPRGKEKKLSLKWGKAINTDVLKVGKHGSDDATSYELLRYVNPNHAIISVSKKGNNPLGAPKKSVLSNLNQSGSTIHNTSKNGHIAVYTDGESLRVKHNAFPFVSTR
jgi:competence protein ComEC